MEIIGIISGIISIVGAVIYILTKAHFLSLNKGNWGRVFKGARKVIKEMADDHYLPDVIIAGGRGGAILGALISWNLGPNLIRIVYIDFFYKWENKKRDLVFEKKFLQIKNEKVLVCVGEVNSGDTLRKLVAEVEKYNPSDIKTASVFNNKSRLISVDYIGQLRNSNKMPQWHYQNFDISQVLPK